MTVDLSLELDREGDLPLYRQIAEQIIRQIEERELPRESRLPTVRELARRLEVTRVTVHSAYSWLQERGWIDATVGRGTFVSGPPTPVETVDLGVGPVTPQRALTDMRRFSRMSGVLSLAMAEPDERLYPHREFLRQLQALGQGAGVFSYGSSLGVSTLRHQLARRLAARGVDAEPEAIQVTSGATQALALAVRALGEAGDTALVEEPTYLGLRAILEAQGIRPVGVPLDEEGPVPEVLETLIHRERPRFLYVIPDFQNPTGLTMSATRRRQVLEIAGRHGLPILEDIVYRDLVLDPEEPPPPPLATLDDQGLVTLIDSFSKTLLPGLRIGYVVAPPRIRERVVSTYQVNELCGPPLLQRALAEFLDKGSYDDHLRGVLPRYRERRDVLLKALAREMPEGVTWTRPRGGFCCWMTLTHGGCFDDLYGAALRRGVAYTPGEVFQGEPPKPPALRLCFGTLEPRRLRDAIATLGELVQQRSCAEPLAEVPIAECAPLV